MSVRSHPRRSRGRDCARSPPSRFKGTSGELDDPRKDGAWDGRGNGSRHGRKARNHRNAAHSQRQTKSGQKVRATAYVGVRPVDLLVSEMAVIAFPDGQATLLETGPGVTVAQIVAATEADLVVPDKVPEMQL